MITPAEHEARNQRFAKILLDEVNRMNSASTPAGGGEISPAATDRSTSLAFDSGEAVTVAPPNPEQVPAAAGADDRWLDNIWRVHPPLSRRIVCSASSDGTITIRRENRIGGETGIALTAAEARTVFQFLEDAAPIFERIAP